MMFGMSLSRIILPIVHLRETVTWVSFNLESVWRVGGSLILSSLISRKSIDVRV